ncbi:phosphoglycerate mutase [Rhodococcoides trifolii]|uniref:Phosphoglycerate mutase n=1 Tax=Rhodococcoides trifolii TaxID=908250 RepID=A0A917CJB3_9NOCA|nr:histidine phosphatase family protein [Rhodococcus trifolii]GGF90594.1 phosphoglycerate mutase [Rhodococcus trifolii]
MTDKLILVRHGQTFSNVAKRLDTLPPGAALTPEGHAQAAAFGKVISGRTAAVVSSIALRAKETAGYIAEATGVELQVVDGLQETYVGEFEDRTDDEAHEAFQNVYRRWLDGDVDARLSGGESARDVFDRYLPVLDSLRDRTADGNVYVVSHGAAIRLVAAKIGAVDAEFAAANHLGNTETVELVPTADGWDCVRWSTFTPPFHTQPPDTRGVEVLDDPMG